MKKNTLQNLLLLLLFTVLIVNSIAGSQQTLIVFHLDLNSVSLRKDYIEKWLQIVADMGYNAVLWEIEDEVRWQTCPECASPDAFSKTEFMNLLDYSRRLGLQPIPLLQTVGHAEYVLQHEKYHAFREEPDRHDCYCAGNAEVRDFIKRWINEYLELFGAVDYFHLGADEVHALGSCETCSAAAGKIGKIGLYVQHLQDISADLIDKGIRPCIWDDMVMKYPAEIASLPRDFVLWDWNYWDTDESPNAVMVHNEGKRRTASELTDEIKNTIPEILDGNGRLRSFYVSDFLHRNGYDVITCSSSRSHGDAVFTGRQDVHAGNIIAGAKKCLELGLLGTCVTSWAVRVVNYEIQKPWLFLAPLTMQHPHLKKEELLSITSDQFFGVKGGEFFDAITDAGFPFPFADKNTTGIMWTGMKDSRPAPAGYIRGLIDRWKRDEDWESKKQIIADAPQKIADGLGKLHRFTVKAGRGYDIIHAWCTGASFQFWQAVIAAAIVQKADHPGDLQTDQITDHAHRLERQYAAWANEWMTPASAEQNTALIYDAILEFLQENGTE